MFHDKLSWIIALLTELKDNPDSVLEVQVGHLDTWKQAIELPRFNMHPSRYRVVKPKKYRLFQHKNSAVPGIVISADTTWRALYEADVANGRAVWLTEWLPLPEAK